MPDIRLSVDGVLYGGWKSIRVSRSIEQVAGSFQLAVSELWPGQDFERRIKDGDACELLVDGQALVTGYVDEVAIAHDDKQHAVSIAGRDRTADIVDCSAIKGAGQWSGRKLEQIAADLCKPFGITVRAEVDTGKAFGNFALQEGETVFEAIERMARMRALLLTTDGRGSLVITRPGTQRVATPLVLGGNILGASGSISQRDRYSSYVLKGQAAGDDYFNGTDAAQSKATATDPAVKRYRPLLVVSEGQADGLSLRDRAKWEASVRAARATQITVTVQGWSHADGLWSPNRVVHVNDKWMRLDDDLLISGVALMLDEDGTRAELSLTRPDAFKLIPQPEPSSSASGQFWSLPK